MRLLLAAVLLLQAQAVGAAINLDQLSQCDDLERAFREIRSDRSRCVGPRNAIERALRNGYPPFAGISLCFMANPPTQSLARFNCVRIKTEDVRQLVCFAEADRSDVLEYKARYRTEYASAVRDYLAAANQCGVGNGDASLAVRSLLPVPVAIVARFDLGFTLPVGRGLVGQSVILHGFGLVDPEISGQDDQEVEFFSMYAKERG